MHVRTPRWRSALALTGIGALAACSDDSGTLAPIDPPGEEATQVAAVTCTVQVARGTVECGEAGPAPGPRYALIFGGQGTYVKLVSSGAAYDGGTEVFSVDVTVENLFDQPMGTTDGTTVSGVQVFFPSDPVVTSGSGDVSVANPDGTGTFTAANQAYFDYAQILAPREVSALKEWQFDVDPLVNTFTFTVYVHTSIPNQVGVGRWLRVSGRLSATEHYKSIWASAANDVFMADRNGVWHYNGATWRRTSIPLPAPSLYALWGFGPRDVWMTGNNGRAYRYDGRHWNLVPTGTAQHLYSVWGAVADSVYAVGTGGAIRRFDGTAWTGMASGSSAILYGVWGSSSDSVYAVGTGGTILRLEGGTWTPMTSGTTRRLWSVWGTGRDDVFAVGDSGTILHYDGTGWTPMASGTTADLYAVQGRDSADVVAAGDLEVVLRYDGTDWTQEPTDLFPDTGGGQDFYDIWLAPGAEYIVGTRGTILTEGAGVWEVESGQAPTNGSAWANSPSDVFVGGDEEILHFNGSAWTSTSTPGFDASGIWGSGPANVFAVGRDGAIRHYDGASWTSMASPPGVGTNDHLLAIWGSGPSDVWAVGDGEGSVCLVLHYDGSTWTHLPGLTCGNLVDVWGTGPSHAVAVDAQYVYRWNGSTWTRDLTFPAAGTLRGIWAYNPVNVYVAGSTGIHYFNGFGWSQVSALGNLHDVKGTSQQNVVAVGSSGRILLKTAGGWLQMASGTGNNLFEVVGAGHIQMYVVGTEGTILHGVP